MAYVRRPAFELRALEKARLAAPDRRKAKSGRACPCVKPAASHAHRKVVKKVNTPRGLVPVNGSCPWNAPSRRRFILWVFSTREGGRDRSRRIRKYVRLSNRDLKRLLEGRMTLSRSAFSKRFLESE